jgi:hypothetical protein
MTTPTPEPQPVLITGDEVDAFTSELLALQPCTTCGGQRALLIEHGDTVLPTIAHERDCVDLVSADLERHLRLVTGDGGDDQ